MADGPGVAYAEARGVNVEELHKKITDGLAGVSIEHFTDAELQVLKACLEVACEW